MTQQLIRILLFLGAIHSALVAVRSVSAFSVSETNGVITIRTPTYQIGITKKDFRYGFAQPDGRVIAPPAADYGLEFGGGHSADTKQLSSKSQSVLFEVTNDQGEVATVEIEPADHHVRFGVTQLHTNRVLARIGDIAPAFGLADHAAVGRTNTDVTGFSDGHFRAQEPPASKRLISNFIISPGRGIAVVNMEKGMKLVRVLQGETAQGVAAATRMPALYYFLGSPMEIYAAFFAGPKPRRLPRVASWTRRETVPAPSPCSPCQIKPALSPAPHQPTRRLTCAPSR